jgi:Ca2+-binding EF-hand superfamily protein
MKSSPLVFVSWTSVVLFASCAAPGRREFNALDSNRDKKVTEAEFFDHITSESFRALDADHDGKVTRKEWVAKESTPRSRRLFTTFDMNHDGAVVPAEFTASKTKRRQISNIFHTVDRNHDGGLEWNEVHSR